MSLAAAPTFTPATAPANLVASSTLTNGTPITANFYVGVSGQSGAQGTTTTGSALSGTVQVTNTGPGTITAGSYVQVQIFSSSDGGTTYDTTPLAGCNIQIPTVASTAQSATITLLPGQYQINLTNSDASHTTTVKASIGTTA